MSDNQITNLLTAVLIVLISILFILVVVYVILLKKRNASKKEKKVNKAVESKEDIKTTSNNVESIFKFMEFDKIQDNMIIQKEKHKYIMVVECQGVNYDLMSGMEKTGVEEGFLQFLNTLRHPVQLYVQTRTVDLGNSINTYKEKVSQIETELYRLRQQYQEMLESDEYSKEDINKMFFKLTKQTNLYEYGKDIISDTEKMSLNKNILNKKYYVVIPYYPSDLGDNEFDENEIRNIAFSELYTRSQAIIRTLSACSVKGKILNSRELAELLYIAYNRDQAEDYGLDKAINAQYDKLYSTSEDIFNKKTRELDKIIEDKAVKKALSKVEEAKSIQEEEYKEKQRKMDNLIDEMAKIILEGNREYIGDDVVDIAIEEIAKEKKKNPVKGGKVNAKEETGKKTTRTRKKAN